MLQLASLARRASLLEIAQHGSSGIARLLGQPDTLAANSSSACRRSRCNCPAARALELALSFPESFDFLADRNGRRLRSRADDFAGWLLKPKLPMQQGSLLRSKALTEVESAESAYVHAIDKLAADAKPQLDNRPRR